MSEKKDTCHRQSSYSHRESTLRCDVRSSVACVCIQIVHVKHLRACPGQGELLIRLDKRALTCLADTRLRLRKGQLLSNITLLLCDAYDILPQAQKTHF